MSEGKAFAAVGAFADDGSENTVTVPGNVAEVIAALDEIVAKYDMGEALSEEDKAIVKAYLPAIGADDTSLSADNAFVGEGSFAFDHSELGCDVHVEGKAGCRGVGEGRIEWSNEMSVTKTGGTTDITDFAFRFQGVGFGVGPTGIMKVIYKRDFSRAFEASESAFASIIDRYTLIQWGFYYKATCKLSTSKGDITIA